MTQARMKEIESLVDHGVPLTADTSKMLILEIYHCWNWMTELEAQVTNASRDRDKYREDWYRVLGEKSSHTAEFQAQIDRLHALLGAELAKTQNPDEQEKG